MHFGTQFINKNIKSMFPGREVVVFLGSSPIGSRTQTDATLPENMADGHCAHYYKEWEPLLCSVVSQMKIRGYWMLSSWKGQSQEDYSSCRRRTGRCIEDLRGRRKKRSMWCPIAGSSSRSRIGQETRWNCRKRRQWHSVSHFSVSRVCHQSPATLYRFVRTRSLIMSM